VVQVVLKVISNGVYPGEPKRMEAEYHDNRKEVSPPPARPPASPRSRNHNRNHNGCGCGCASRAAERAGRAGR
jgi:hypothetical protein